VPIRACVNFGRASAPRLPPTAADEIGLDVGEPHVVRPAVGANLDVVTAAAMVAQTIGVWSMRRFGADRAESIAPSRDL
jgi:hypothetical protein